MLHGLTGTDKLKHAATHVHRYAAGVAAARITPLALPGQLYPPATSCLAAQFIAATVAPRRTAA